MIAPSFQSVSFEFPRKQKKFPKIRVETFHIIKWKLFNLEPVIMREKKFPQGGNIF